MHYFFSHFFAMDDGDAESEQPVEIITIKLLKSPAIAFMRNLKQTVMYCCFIHNYCKKIVNKW